jgi:hypothetical protein
MTAVGVGTRSLEDWLVAFGEVGRKCRLTPGSFCVVFEGTVWKDFERELLSYLYSTFGNDSPSTTFEAALDTFFSLRPEFLLRGCIVDSQCFKELVRVQRDIDLRFLNQRLWNARQLSIDKVARFTDADFDRYFGDWARRSILLTGRRSMVWALDAADLDSLAPNWKSGLSSSVARDIVKALGLVDLSKVIRVVLMSYGRTSPTPVEPRTPTPIDGMGHSLFSPKNPCDKRGGQTVDATGRPGFREAVHKPVELRNIVWLVAHLA